MTIKNNNFVECCWLPQTCINTIKGCSSSRTDKFSRIEVRAHLNKISRVAIQQYFRAFFCNNLTWLISQDGRYNSDTTWGLPADFSSSFPAFYHQLQCNIIILDNKWRWRGKETAAATESRHPIGGGISRCSGSCCSCQAVPQPKQGKIDLENKFYQ